jgi:hypothetical protein
MDTRQRLEQLLTDSGTYQQGRQDERDRIVQLIDIRIDELSSVPGIRNRQQLCAELLHIRQHLEQ